MAEKDTSAPITLPTGKLLIYGTGLGIAAIALFGVLWLGLGQMGTSPLIRIVASVCIPPALMTVAAIGLYFIRTKNTSS